MDRRQFLKVGAVTSVSGNSLPEESKTESSRLPKGYKVLETKKTTTGVCVIAQKGEIVSSFFFDVAEWGVVNKPVDLTNIMENKLWEKYCCMGKLPCEITSLRCCTHIKESPEKMIAGKTKYSFFFLCGICGNHIHSVRFKSLRYRKRQ